MRTLATYRIFGDDAALTAERVTAALGVQPSKSWEVGAQRGGGTPPVMQAGWMLESNRGGPLDGVELSESLRRVIAVLRPRRESVWRLVDVGYRVDWFCYLGSHAAEHAAELPRDLLAELLDLPGALLLDVYRDGPDED